MPIYIGWPRKNATLTITIISKKSGTRSNKWVHKCIETCKMTPISVILMNRWRRFDSLKQCHFKNVLLLICIKSHDWGSEVFLWVPSPDCNTAELRNECFSLFMLSLCFKAGADTLPGEAKQWKIFGRQLWLLRQKWQIKKKWHYLRKTAIESNAFIKMNDLAWCRLAGIFFLYAIMHTTFFNSVPRFLEI